jgi:hypothetical protein
VAFQRFQRIFGLISWNLHYAESRKKYNAITSRRMEHSLGKSASRNWRNIMKTILAAVPSCDEASARAGGALLFNRSR